jgi:hypothetical protein
MKTTMRYHSKPIRIVSTKNDRGRVGIDRLLPSISGGNVNECTLENGWTVPQATGAGTEAHAYKPSYSGDGDWENHGLRPAQGEKVSKTTPQQKSQALWHTLSSQLHREHK